jgi:hypothetical protein
MAQDPPPYPPPFSQTYAPPFAQPFRDQRKVDNDHLKLLATLHFIAAGLGVLGILSLFLNHAIFEKAVSDARMMQNQPDPFDILPWIYLGLGAWYALSGLLNAVAGSFIRDRKHRLFCLIVSGVNCLHFPLGTALGVFTMIVLARGSVRQIFEESAVTST